jgi:glycosyltransferase involved in cell wall biosynthesis
MTEALDITVVIPLYNEEESITELCNWISRVMDTHGFHFEVIMVDDGSSDASWAKVLAISSKNPAFKGLRFNRNHGKSAALNTAFKYARGQVVITMDADMQDSPDEIPELYRMVASEGWDLVSGWKKVRHDPVSKTIPSRFFNMVTRMLSGIRLHDFNCGLKAYKNIVIKNISVYGEMHRYIPVICKWNGFGRITEKVVEHRPRKYGQTKFGIERFIFGFLDLLSISFVTRFMKRPMHFFGSLGSLSFLMGLIITAYLIGEKVYNIHHQLRVRDVVQQPLFYLALVAIVVGVQLFLAGFLAELNALNMSRETNYLLLEKVGYSERHSAEAS